MSSISTGILKFELKIEVNIRKGDDALKKVKKKKKHWIIDIDDEASIWNIKLGSRHCRIKKGLWEKYVDARH